MNIPDALRKLALRLPDVEEGVACAGTALEKRTLKTGKKAFLFLGAADAMLKLAASLPEARRFAADEPERYKVGASGWVTIRYSSPSLPLETLERWIAESHGLMAKPSSGATKRVGPTAARKKPPARRKR